MPRLIYLSILMLLLASVDARATSLDDIYRDLVRSEHAGYLPIFVKNRAEMGIPGADMDLAETPNEKAKKNEEAPSDTIFLTNRRQARDVRLETKQQRWERAVNAVKNNTVTPVELEEIERFALENDPRAIELLAWMYANGVGVGQDLAMSFSFYQRASQMGIPNAAENALLVYRSMTPAQREQLNSFTRN